MTRLPNRYGSAFVEKTDEEDAADFETWCEMSEAEQDAVLAQTIREHNAWWENLSPDEQYAVRRRNALRSCISSRNVYAMSGLSMFREHIRDAQKRLLKLRMERYHGMEAFDA